ncbi:hypothetical protein KRX52_05755 [Pseudomonas sp. MAP12]|uniref:Uncharacterized protein n=1 Tax=Geopseudomonas aromaticivorans TaxID=2849492 RepID=A0ABS6MU23_9GAMM|nr:hypothetical protein [Pseudomonas aromaticivorans]MBV2132305.1 hypothetical protein [Pseudomonas aromaticivorans]
MRGEFVGVWSETWSAIWLPLAESEVAPSDIFCELYRELAGAFALQPSVEVLADVIDDPKQSWQAFEASGTTEFASEKALVRFFEAAFEILEDLQGDELSNRYFGLLSAFIEKYSLGYSLRRPCALSLTLPGMFADLSGAMKRLASTDEHIYAFYRAHEEAVRDLRYGATEERIKTCISRQVMLLEAIAASADEVTAHTLGDMCNQLTSWPHATIKESLKKLYGFASDYPGIRHAGNPGGRLRGIETRDLAALSILLMGYAPYLTIGLETNFTSLVDG